MINERFKSIIDSNCNTLQGHEDAKKALNDEIIKTRDNYADAIVSEFSNWLKENKFFKTRDGYIAVNYITGVLVAGLAKYNPRIVLEGFYLRGIDGTKADGVPYGYYDTQAGFLLGELIPVSEELFCSKAKEVCEAIIKALPYKPTVYYRGEDDDLDLFLTDARKGKLDVDYYPEVKVSIIK